MQSWFSRCDCGFEHFERIPRRWWMRLLPGRRFYRCGQCGKEQLASERAVNEAVWERRAQNRRLHQAGTTVPHR
jgi:hypothetical protein